jgi:ribosome biogenesis GTPase
VAGRQYDEDDVRVRPAPRSRPRTRTRPAHETATDGLVTAVDRGRYTCLVDGSVVTAMRARELGRKSVVVGDNVAIVGDVTGAKDALARIVRIASRTSVLRRTADDIDPNESIVVANVDQLVIVTSLADPEPNMRWIDRCLVAAYDAGIEPLLCLTKTDLASSDDLVALYSPLGVRSVVSGSDDGGRGVTALRTLVTGRTSAFIGPSGAGKSTLVNQLVPDARRLIGEVSAATGKGKHTSTSVVALPLPRGGWVFDTPGIRSFGLAHVSVEAILDGFDDLHAAAEDCPPGCDHLNPACALDSAVTSGAADPRRLDSFRRLLLSREGKE